MAYTREEIVARVNEVLVDEFEVVAAGLEPGTRLQEDLELDSLDAVDLIVALEQALGIRTDEEEAKKIGTLGELYDFVEKAAVPSA